MVKKKMIIVDVQQIEGPAEFTRRFQTDTEAQKFIAQKREQGYICAIRRTAIDVFV